MMEHNRNVMDSKVQYKLRYMTTQRLLGKSFVFATNTLKVKRYLQRVMMKTSNSFPSTMPFTQAIPLLLPLPPHSSHPAIVFRNVSDMTNFDRCLAIVLVKTGYYAAKNEHLSAFAIA